MQKNFSFRQKLGGAFALLLSLILLHGTVAWFALQEYGNLFQELHTVEQIVELTTRARMNEKNYVLTGERHLAIAVQEELEEAQNMVHDIIQHNSYLEVSILVEMSNSLGEYRTTFSQYVVYEDQQRALTSEGDQLTKDFLTGIDDLQQLDKSLTNDIVNRMYLFLLVNKNIHFTSEQEHLSTQQAGQEMLALIKRLHQTPGSTSRKLAIYRIAVITEDYLHLLNKIKQLEEQQHLNEGQMKTAAEEVQNLGKIASKNQQIRAQQGQQLTTKVLMVIFLLSTGIAIWGTFYLSTRLTRPLKDLVSLTSSLGKGHFQERITIDSDDEFHNLLLSINQMAENIANLTSNMEGLVKDRTKALAIEKIRFEKLFEHNPEGILIFDEDMYVIDANDAFTSIFGYTLPEIFHQKIQDFLLLDDQIPNLLSSTREETVRRCKNGDLIPVSIIRYSFQQPGEKNLHYIIYTDISERKAAEERLHFLSFHDSLTALKNRTFFELEMKRLQNSHEACGLIVCDVDGLKFTNDTFGHGAGDELLKNAAQLLASVADKHSLARVGGDEFVIFLPGSLEEETCNMVASINDKLAITNPDDVYPLKISVGYAHRQNGTIHMEDLFSFADTMMYSVKNRRRQSSQSTIS